MGLKYHQIKVREDDYQAIVRAKSRYEAKTGKVFNGMGSFLKEVSELLG